MFSSRNLVYSDNYLKILLGKKKVFYERNIDIGLD